MIAIAVAAAVLTYTWVMTMISTTGSQAQTTIRIDEVAFGQYVFAGIATATQGSTTISADEVIGQTTISVTATTGFAVGDFVQIAETDKASNYGKITAIGVGTITIDTATTVAYTATNNPTVKEVEDGIKLTIRNTGSVVAVIQTVYVYKGDTQILKYDEIGYAIQAGKLGDLGLRQSDATWSSLKPTMTAAAQNIDVMFADYLLVSAGYKIKVITDNDFVTEGTYTTPSAFE